MEKTTKEPLTKRQEDMYAFIAGYIQDYGYAPASIEIAMKFQMTTQGVDQHVKNLVRKGWLDYSGGRYHKIKLVP